MYINTLSPLTLIELYEDQMRSTGEMLFNPPKYQDQITSSPVEDVIAHFQEIIKPAQVKALNEYRRSLWLNSGVFMHSDDWSGKMVDIVKNKYRGQRGLVISHDHEKGICLVLLRNSMQSVWLDLTVLEFQPFSKGERDYYKGYEGGQGDVIRTGTECKSSIDGEVYVMGNSVTSKMNYKLQTATNSKGKDVWVCVRTLKAV